MRWHQCRHICAVLLRQAKICLLSLALCNRANTQTQRETCGPGCGLATEIMPRSRVCNSTNARLSDGSAATAACCIPRRTGRIWPFRNQVTSPRESTPHWSLSGPCGHGIPPEWVGGSKPTLSKTSPSCFTGKQYLPQRLTRKRIATGAKGIICLNEPVVHRLIQFS